MRDQSLWSGSAVSAPLPPLLALVALVVLAQLRWRRVRIIACGRSRASAAPPCPAAFAGGQHQWVRGYTPHSGPLPPEESLGSAAGVGQPDTGRPSRVPSRPFCQAGLQKTYGLAFKGFVPLDAGGPLSKAALEKGDVDVALIFTSDGVIAAKDFVVLEDDRHLQNADNVVPVIRSSVASDDVVSLLNGISSKLTTQALIELNQSSQLDREDPDVLAQRWLSSHGY